MHRFPYLRIIRPHHYLKNMFVLAPLFFGRMLTHSAALEQALIAFAVFCLSASAMYVFNDVRDIENDRRHPSKRNRPLVSGDIGIWKAICYSSMLSAVSLLLSFRFLHFKVSLVLLSYLILNILYSLGLKKIAIVDIHCIAIGFVLRILAGGLAIDVPVSNWLITITYLLALFFALSKRQDELTIDKGNTDIRPAIRGYNLEFVRTAMAIMSGVIIVCYVLYTVSPEVTDKAGTATLFYTIVWVILGFFRYLQITFVYHQKGSPTDLLFKDVWLFLIGICWVTHYLLILYL